jgi:hypothetical protein
MAIAIASAGIVYICSSVVARAFTSRGFRLVFRCAKYLTRAVADLASRNQIRRDQNTSDL